MTAEIRIRQASLDDLPTLLEFEQGVVEAERPYCPHMQKEHFHYYDLESLIKDDKTEVLVAEQNGQLLAAGYSQLRPAKHFMDHDTIGYLGFMFVAPEHRGKGLNKLIMDALINWTHQQGVEHFVLDVFSENDSAIRAYEKAGFAPHLTEMIMNKPKI